MTINLIDLLYKNKKSAFTLLELSIVIVIISFIAFSVLKVQDIIRNNKISAMMQDISILQRAVADYENIYKQLPGDTFNSNKIFTDNSTNGDPSITKGNGNGVIDGNEGIYAFQHLVYAGLISGSYNGTYIYKNMYKCPIDGCILYFTSQYNDSIVLRAAKAASTLDAANLSSISNGMTSSLLSLPEMVALDKKYDNGIANTGNIRAYNGTDLPSSESNSCVNSSGDYNMLYINSDKPRCYFDVRIKQNIFN